MGIDQLTDQQTDRLSHIASHRVACRRLKMEAETEAGAAYTSTVSTRAVWQGAAGAAMAAACWDIHP